MANQAPADKPSGTNLGGLAAREPVQQVKGFLRNLALYDDMEQTEFNDTIEFWFRPANVRESGGANYQETEVLGMSHKYRTYSSTNNFKFTFDLYFNSLMRLKQYTTARGRQDLQQGNGNDMVLLADEIETQRKFIEALVIPFETPAGIIGAENPTALLVIPGIVSIRCKLDTFNFEFRDVTMDGKIKELSCQIAVTEQPMERITMRDHLATGCQRTWGQ